MKKTLIIIKLHLTWKLQGVFYIQLRHQDQILFFATNVVSRFCSNPKEKHWKAVKRIFRYLKGTVNYKLIYCKEGNEELECYSDADWGNELEDRHSISGSCLKLMGGLVSWICKRQRTVALSTVEAEYMALSTTVQETLWLKNLMNEIEADNNSRTTTVYCDNQGAINLAKNNVTSARTKHIDVRHHFIRDHIEKKNIEVKYLSSEEMLADLLTKPLTKERFQKIVRQYVLIDGTLYTMPKNLAQGVLEM